MKKCGLVMVAVLASTAHADDRKEVLAPVEHRDPPVMLQPQPGAKQKAEIATVVAGTLVVAAGFSYMWAQHVAAPLDDLALENPMATDQTRAIVSELPVDAGAAAVRSRDRGVPARRNGRSGRQLLSV